MFGGKLMKIIGIGLLGGVLLYACGTSTDDDDSVTPSPSPSPEPEYLDFDTTMTIVEVDESNLWYYELDTVGWAEDAPYVVAYDNYDIDYYDHDPNSSKLWTEDITLDTLYEEKGDVTVDPPVPYSQIWYRDDLSYVESYEQYVEDVNTILTYDNANDYTFVFYATDKVYGGEICTAIGMWPEVFGSSCLY